MMLISVKLLLIAAMGLYMAAGFVSLLLIRQQKLCNIISNLICIAASLSGAGASIIELIFERERVDWEIFRSDIPFFAFEIKFDHLSAFFVLSLSVLVLAVSIYSMGYIAHYIGKRNVGLFYFLYSAFILSMLLVITSGNAIFFLIAWEAMSLLSYFLVVYESEHPENREAGTLYIIMTHVGTAFLWAGFMVMYSFTGSFDMFAGAEAIPGFARNIMFLLFLIGFGTKAGVIPFHVWLPYAHPAAPGNISALMSGIMIKTAIYGLLRFVFDYLTVEETWWGVTVLSVGIVSAVLGVSYTFMMTNLKKLLAYSSIENIGIIFIGLGAGFIASSQGNAALCALALTAALLHSFNHTLFKGGLFLGIGSVHFSTHTKNMEELGGLIKRMPVTAALVLGGALSISAIVPFNGFIGEWLTLQSLFAGIASGDTAINILSILAVAAMGMVGAMAAASFVKLFGISFLGLPRSEQALQAKEVPVSMSAGAGLLTGLCLLLGLFPMTILSLLDQVVAGMAGVSLFKEMEGGLFLAYYPLKLSHGSISPLAALIALLAFILLTLAILRILGGKYHAKPYGTWDCGFVSLTPRMQYSAAAFSNPIEIAFKLLFRPSARTVTEGDGAYHPMSMEHIRTFEYIFEKHLYDPVFEILRTSSRRMKLMIQTGSIHNYLLYILLTVLALLLYNRFA